MSARAPLRMLVVDDEPAIRRFLRTSLAAQGHQVIEVEDGEPALEAMRRSPADVVILDLGLPGLDGFEVIRRLREKGSTVPIIVLSSRTDERGKVEALDLGADDYLTKPFGVDELHARVRAALRHRLQQQGERPVFRSGDLTVDLVRRLVLVRGEELRLSPREYDILRLLVAHAGKVLTHRFILREVWGSDTDVQYLRVYIRALRQKIEADLERPRHILTETGVGYRLRAPDWDRGTKRRLSAGLNGSSSLSSRARSSIERAPAMEAKPHVPYANPQATTLVDASKLIECGTKNKRSKETPGEADEGIERHCQPGSRRIGGGQEARCQICKVPLKDECADQGHADEGIEGQRSRKTERSRPSGRQEERSPPPFGVGQSEWTVRCPEGQRGHREG